MVLKARVLTALFGMWGFLRQNMDGTEVGNGLVLVCGEALGK
jgi:hypothetical protein